MDPNKIACNTQSTAHASHGSLTITCWESCDAICTHLQPLNGHAHVRRSVVAELRQAHIAYRVPVPGVQRCGVDGAEGNTLTAEGQLLPETTGTAFVKQSL